MGQALYLNKILGQDFEVAVSDKTNVQNIFSFSYETLCIDQSFQGLEYVIKKCVAEDSQPLISEIFFPENNIISQDYDLAESEIDNLSEEEYIDYISKLEGNVFLYLTQSKVKDLNTLLSTISVEEFSNYFNADELNKQKIYPWVWNNNNTEEDAAYNVTALTEDFISVKDFFKKAAVEDCYIISTIG